MRQSNRPCRKAFMVLEGLDEISVSSAKEVIMQLSLGHWLVERPDKVTEIRKGLI